MTDMHLFEKFLSVSAEDIGLRLLGCTVVEWLDFLLNPRRLRGSDFLMRWSQGVWSEERIVQAINDTTEFFAIPYGPSGAAPDKDIRSFELYFERLEKAGFGKNKRPDLLIFKNSSRETICNIVNSFGGINELPFIPESDDKVRKLLDRAILAVECENSLWKGKLMPDYGKELKPQKRLGGKLGLKKNAVLPTLILKEEDRKPLQEWQNMNNVPIHIWHAFYDIAFGISFSEVQKLINEGFILPTEQVFQSPGGVITKKLIYKIYYHHAYPLDSTIEEPRLQARFLEDKNGHILPYVHFEGGKMTLSEEALSVLRKAGNAKN
ncbi:AccI family restriction endonuclease [Chloracidobacterium aggregatum]|uniref:AccI family restriction endonuclease n=2 Tax=Chloracidobacterium TaxID=458032 RepID=A0ABX8B5B7_9BACT|nr:AccI family restriction endonuclease [Chloracidobacterium aggregatum]QUV84911.1 AccI family restriction endonuclease [Chloracidobacterium sp. 2]QUV94781.1 AccI family restriction endonuclease [Chloracidobacterium sp. N]QUV95890.1 AccI family restriction endonuclease [Chloracidobacterium sp. E]QUV88685.1 AccI family restriction endonuclease [Chloracidobacterium sp. S]QUV91605.1 AccI family restriction endonuclease [Chloracidobacterium sp. A]